MIEKAEYSVLEEIAFNYLVNNDYLCSVSQKIIA